ncbi:hypothetical protein BDA96_08G007500 [Sorghum bicolor]|uniref:DUF4220 domain-containing protein n=1 Tax=Sorghum bicolor TaxID=4558 RepID=A0A921QG20_SORBI|nr:hypothetical protein BDA96_08G007500 [Sorghum bicolor]
MGGLTSAVHWWEEWQLRVLVFTSLAIQFFLLFFPYLRRLHVPGWFRFIMWLAYHGGDAVVIYALATLFNRHKDEEEGDGGGTLEVVWAPVLLIHLGGCDGVTAYNIEDNELWSRHLLTAVSQVTVAVYVFCKSWPGGDVDDKRLLQTAILLFTVGIGKCLVKAWAFKRASIYSLVSSAKQINDGSSMYNKLDEYVQLARDVVVVVVVRQQDQDQQEEEDPVTTTTSPGRPRVVEVKKRRPSLALFYWPRPRGLSSSQDDDDDEAAEGSSSSNHHPAPSPPRAETTANNNTRRQERLLFEEPGEASKLFVDLSSPYPRRITIFEKFWGLTEERAYDTVQGGLASAFFLLYTKLKTCVPEDEIYQHIGYETGGSVGDIVRTLILLSRMVLPWASIGLFHHSHREAYNGIDVKVTYAILWSTALLEAYSFYIVHMEVLMDKDGPRVNNKSSRDTSPKVLWPETVAQYSVAGYFVRNKKHSIKMGIASFFQCKDFLDQLWCMEPCFSSARITKLVLQYLKDGWRQEIEDADSYRSFNNHSSHWGLKMNRPFDECVLLWHLATDFCFFSSSSFPDHKCAGCSQESVECKAVRCRQMSNYMVYLLFVNPEMLLPGTRRNIFKTAHRELKGILRGWEWNPVCWSRCMPCGVKLMEEEVDVMGKLIRVMKNKTAKRPASQEETSDDTVITVTQEKPERSCQEEGDGSFIHQAWDLAERLLEMDEMERWKEIQDVWVQMLCFSASRCRGYLHAKALGKGDMFVSFSRLSGSLF